MLETQDLLALPAMLAAEVQCYADEASWSLQSRYANRRGQEMEMKEDVLVFGLQREGNCTQKPKWNRFILMSFWEIVRVKVVCSFWLEPC